MWLELSTHVLVDNARDIAMLRETQQQRGLGRTRWLNVACCACRTPGKDPPTHT
jgi:hypothetical protein